MNAKAVAAWSAACLFVVLFTTNPIYKLVVLAAAFTALVASAGWTRMKRLTLSVGAVAAVAVLLNFISAHLGATVLFRLPASIPAIGGPYTLEALVFGVSGGLTLAAAILAAAPFSLLLQPHEVMDALPTTLARTGTAIAASVNLVPSISSSYVEVSEAQRLRGWRPRGPRSWAEVVVPVVLTSVEKSIQLAESMEARGFGSGPRTSFEPAAMDRKDWLLIAASAFAIVMFLAAQLAGLATEWYAYPILTAPSLDALSLGACALLFTPVLTWRSRA